MPPVCPTCNSALDPTHAPVARVRAAKVVTYCSTVCAKAADTGAVAMPKDLLKDPEASVKASTESESTESESTETESTETESTETESTETESTETESTESESKAEGAADATSAKTSPRRSGTAPVLYEVPPSRLSSSLRKRVLLACGIIMLGGMAIAVIQAVSPSTPSTASASQQSNAPGTRGKAQRDSEPAAGASSSSEAKSKPSPPAPVDLRGAAIAELEQNLDEGSPRFQRLAGMALARIKHAGAIAVLERLLQSEDSDLSRIDVAYGLALAGAEKGRAHLVAELESKRRDVRIDAARRLAELGDDAGRKALTQMLSVRSHRLGAAGVLALLDDEKGLEVLRQTLADDKASPENQMRAAVALGRAGQDAARERLLSILKEGRYVVDAAGALATLGDSAAIPALKRQLELTAMRVKAAEAFVRMQQEVVLTSMADALVTGNREGRVSAAEAILILSSPGEGE